MNERRIRVWDLPTRIFHWPLPVVVGAAVVTGLQGGNLMVWHGRLGVLLGGLLAFRLAWGVVGSSYARFSHFVRGPGAIRAYLRGQWRGAGHNPLGALSVLLLAVLAVQVATGLAANDDIAFNGPLYPAVSKDTSDWLTSLHHRNVWLIGVLVGLHVLAVLHYARVRRENLVKPMLTGFKVVSDPAHPSARGGGPVAIVVALAVAGLVVWAASGNLLPPAPPPPAPETLPDW